jgi:hypothetical protein
VKEVFGFVHHLNPKKITFRRLDFLPSSGKKENIETLADGLLFQIISDVDSFCPIGVNNSQGFCPFPTYLKTEEDV